MLQLIRWISAIMLSAVLCGASCRRDEPAPAPNRPPGQDVAVDDGGRPHQPESDPEPSPAEDEWEAMAQEARRATEFETYYADYRVYTVLHGDLAVAFGGRDARFVLLVGYEGSEDRFVRRPSGVDRWNLFFGDFAGALDLVNGVRALEEAASARELSAAEESELASMRARLADEERMALSRLTADLYAEVGARRILLTTLAPGSFADLPSPPATMPR